MSTKKIQILSRFTNAVIFAAAVDTMKDCVELAIKKGVSLRNANLAGANMARANMAGAYMARANMAGAYMEGAYMAGACMARANMEGAHMEGACMAGAYMEGANMEGAYMAGANMARANMEGANMARAYMAGAHMEGAHMEGANMEGANLPSPTVVLLASWGVVSNELCADLMLWDASNHPDPAKFDVWANGGDCPYRGVKVQRAANFSESRALWGKGEMCRPYDLMVRVLAEKCPDWSDEYRAEFELWFNNPPYKVGDKVTVSKFDDNEPNSPGINDEMIAKNGQTGEVTQVDSGMRWICVFDYWWPASAVKKAN